MDDPLNVKLENKARNANGLRKSQQLVDHCNLCVHGLCVCTGLLVSDTPVLGPIFDSPSNACIRWLV